MGYWMGMQIKQVVHGVTVTTCFNYLYPRWESNPNLRFRKPPFYPLNYRGSL